MYEFYVYHLEKQIAMDKFNPAGLWGVFRDEPRLTGSMMEFMAWVEKGSEAREPTEEGKEKVRQLLYGTARARAFG
jgi:hypothetical protein